MTCKVSVQLEIIVWIASAGGGTGCEHYTIQFLQNEGEKRGLNNQLSLSEWGNKFNLRHIWGKKKKNYILYNNFGHVSSEGQQFGAGGFWYSH